MTGKSADHAPKTARCMSEFEFVALFSLLTALTALSIDALLPAFREIGAELIAANSVLDVYVLVPALIAGMTVGELVFGPLADAKGRKIALMMGLTVFCLGSLLCYFAESIDALILGRIIQGIGVAGPKIASRATIRDRYESEEMARIMSLILAVLIIVPMIAPLLGQLIVGLLDWRAIFLAYVVCAVLLGLWLAWRHTETLSVDQRVQFSPRKLVRASIAIARTPLVLLLSTAAGAVFGMLLAYYGSAPFMFQELYGKDETFTLYIAMLSIGIGFASLLNHCFVRRYGMSRLALIAAIVMAIVTLFFVFVVVTNTAPPRFEIFLVVFFLLFSCMGVLFGNLGALTMEPLGQVAGLGASLTASWSSLVSVSVSISIGGVAETGLLPFAFGLAVTATLVLALLCIGLMFRKSVSSYARLQRSLS